jgi:hypothetical protein
MSDRSIAMFPEEARVLDTIAKLGPLPAFQQLIAENDALIRGAALDNGRQIAAERTAIYTALVRDWAAEQQQAFGYDKPFAVVALGGTGRAEMTPHSDNDFAFLFADALEANPFLLELQRQVLHSDTFERRCGFTCLALPFSLDDVPRLADKQLNAFLDMRPVHDPQGLAEQFRERIRSTYDPFEHFLHVRGFWKGQWEKAAAESERLDRFDIKHEGLRLFLAGIWTLAGKQFSHSHDIYRHLDDRRDLEAYTFLLRIRAFIHSRRVGQKHRIADGNHPEDVLGFDDFTAFGELLEPAADERTRFEFANDVRARLLAARRRVARFAKAVIERELKLGRPVSFGSPIVFGSGGLCHTAAENAGSTHEKAAPRSPCSWPPSTTASPSIPPNSKPPSATPAIGWNASPNCPLSSTNNAGALPIPSSSSPKSRAPRNDSSPVTPNSNLRSMAAWWPNANPSAAPSNDRKPALWNPMSAKAGPASLDPSHPHAPTRRGCLGRDRSRPSGCGPSGRSKARPQDQTPPSHGG